MSDAPPPRFLATAPILPEGAKPGDQIIPDLKRGCVWLVRRLPANYGRWLGHLTSGAVDPLTLSSEDAADWLVSAVSALPPPPPPTQARRRYRRRA